uniref:Uncharacterized protein n=1 Tax=Strix occidentalis caurina TaxID=311401 RepID=A0A8D0FNZ7_STROC
FGDTQRGRVGAAWPVLGGPVCVHLSRMSRGCPQTSQVYPQMSHVCPQMSRVCPQSVSLSPFLSVPFGRGLQGGAPARLSPRSWDPPAAPFWTMATPQRFGRRR